MFQYFQSILIGIRKLYVFRNFEEKLKNQPYYV